MSAHGPKRTSKMRQLMSVYRGKADMLRCPLSIYMHALGRQITAAGSGVLA
jgi:hypothetical protein